MDEDFEDAPPSLPKLPKKNYNVFSMRDDEIFFAPKIWEGKAGDLPLFLEVNVGYNPDDEDPYMYHYESQELLFLYKRDKQTRALLHDSFQRTLSLPLSSDIQFIARKVGDQPMTLADLAETEALPLQVEFANKELMDFELDPADGFCRKTFDYTYFGDLVFYGTYEENFFWCLAIDAHGKPKDKPIVLPANLQGVCFSIIESVKGAKDPAAKLQEFHDRFLKFAEDLGYDKDPFFQELAIVDRTNHITRQDEVKVHIDQATFVKITYRKRPAPFAPENAPSLPPRKPVPSAPPPVAKKSQGHKARKGQSHDPNNYTPVVFDGDDEHKYESIGSIETEVKGAHKLMKLFQDGGKGGQGPVVPDAVPLYETCGPKGGTYPRQNSKPKVAADPDDVASPRRALSMKEPPPPPARAPALPPRRGTHDVETLSVDDVGERLKQLNLEKYRKKFKKNLIDGVLLKGMSQHTLVKEFRMSAVEALRLTTFASTGHIPQ